LHFFGNKNIMPSFKQPSFQERTALAAKAKEAALAKLRAKPPVDEAVLAARKETALAKEAAKIQASQDRLAARELEKIAKKERIVEVAVKDEVDLKAIRDAKYAARKSRAGKR
jgi:Family of unknown function (DUF6481)